MFGTIDFSFFLLGIFALFRIINFLLLFLSRLFRGALVAVELVVGTVSFVAWLTLSQVNLFPGYCYPASVNPFGTWPGRKDWKFGLGDWFGQVNVINGMRDVILRFASISFFLFLTFLLCEFFYSLNFSVTTSYIYIKLEYINSSSIYS